MLLCLTNFLEDILINHYFFDNFYAKEMQKKELLLENYTLQIFDIDYAYMQFVVYIIFCFSFSECYAFDSHGSTLQKHNFMKCFKTLLSFISKFKSPVRLLQKLFYLFRMKKCLSKKMLNFFSQRQFYNVLNKMKAVKTFWVPFLL